MKVIQILYSGLGGHGSVALSLIEADRDRQWHSVLGFLGVEPVMESYAYFCRQHSIPYKYISAIPKKPYKSWHEIYAWLKKEKPDAIIIHSSRAAIPCLLYSLFYKCSVISVEHQSYDLKNISQHLYTILKLVFSKKTVLLTEEYKNDLTNKAPFLVNKSKLWVINNGVDVRSFSPHIKRFPDKVKNAYSNKIVLGMAARFTNTKRQELLVEAVEYLNKAYPETSWCLSLAGAGQRLNKIQDLARKSDCSANIFFEGYLDGQELVDWYSKLDVYVHATDGETLSTAMLQAMACGLPIIASDVAGVHNLLSLYDDPSVVVNNTPKAFAEAIRDVCTDSNKIRELSEKSRLLATTRFSNEEMFNAYNHLIAN